MNRGLFLFVDFIAYILIIFVAITLRKMEVNLELFEANIYAMLPFFPIFTLTLYFFSFYDIKDIVREKINYSSFLNALFVNVVLAASVLYFLAHPLGMVTPKTVLVAILTLYPLYIYFSRRLCAKFLIYKKNIIIFGESDTITEIKNLIKNISFYNIIGEEAIPDSTKKYPIKDLDFVLISSKLFAQNKEAWPIISQEFIQKGILLKTDFTFYEELFSRAPKEGLQDAMWLMRGIGGRENQKVYYPFKKALDFVISIFMLPLFSLICAFIYLIILAVDRFDPVFKQERVGYMEKTIYIRKFRTMMPGTEKITKLGAILRRFRLDELPQIFNILMGDISLVGPRPIWRKDYDILNAQIPSHNVRSIVKPGLTGWAQLNFKAPPNYAFVNPADFGNNKEVFNDAVTRFSYDVWYIKNRSFSLDVEIVLKTAKRILIKDKNVAKHTS